jgi:hypothetical protein
MAYAGPGKHQVVLLVSNSVAVAFWRKGDNARRVTRTSTVRRVDGSSPSEGSPKRSGTASDRPRAAMGLGGSLLGGERGVGNRCSIH